MVVGGLSFILPIFGRQFVIVSALGLTGIGSVMAGIVLCGIGILLFNTAKRNEGLERSRHFSNYDLHKPTPTSSPDSNTTKAIDKLAPPQTKSYTKKQSSNRADQQLERENAKRGLQDAHIAAKNGDINAQLKVEEIFDALNKCEESTPSFRFTQLKSNLWLLIIVISIFMLVIFTGQKSPTTTVSHMDFPTNTELNRTINSQIPESGILSSDVIPLTRQQPTSAVIPSAPLALTKENVSNGTASNSFDTPTPPDRLQQAMGYMEKQNGHIITGTKEASQLQRMLNGTRSRYPQNAENYVPSNCVIKPVMTDADLLKCR